MHQERAGNKGALSRSNRNYKKGKTEGEFKSQNREIIAKKNEKKEHRKWEQGYEKNEDDRKETAWRKRKEAQI